MYKVTWFTDYEGAWSEDFETLEEIRTHYPEGLGTEVEVIEYIRIVDTEEIYKNK